MEKNGRLASDDGLAVEHADRRASGDVGGTDQTLDTCRATPLCARGLNPIIDQATRTLLGNEQTLLVKRDMVQPALPLIVVGARANALQTITRPDGTEMLGAYAFPDWIPWAVVTERFEESAYAVVNAITRKILIIGSLGFALAGVGAMIIARRLTSPILNISNVVEQGAASNFSARVETLKARDEIGQLSWRVNKKIAELGERFELMKFVSHGTVSAIQSTDEDMSRGGEPK